MATVTREVGRRIVVLAQCDDIFEAEDFIAMMEHLDSHGVHAGLYGIGATEEEYAVYQEYHHRKSHGLRGTRIHGKPWL